MPQVKKQVKEFLLHGFDMVDALQDGETLVSSNENGSLTLTIYDVDEVDVTADIVKDTPLISGSIVSAMIQQGVDLSAYNVEWLIPTSFGQVLEEDATLVVINKKG